MKFPGDQIIAESVAGLIAERDELKGQVTSLEEKVKLRDHVNDDLVADNIKLRAEIQRLQAIEQKYNDWVIFFQSAKVM